MSTVEELLEQLSSTMSSLQTAQDFVVETQNNMGTSISKINSLNEDFQELSDNVQLYDSRITATTNLANAALPKSGGTMTGPIGHEVNSVSTNIDLSEGDVFTKTLQADTTFTFSNLPASGVSKKVTLVISGGDQYQVTWPNTITWAGGSAPELTAGPDVIDFMVVGE